MLKQSFIGRLLRDRKGQGMVEYALLVAGVALVSIIGISIMGEKTGDMIDLVAAILPGSDADDNNAIAQGHLIEDTVGTNGAITVDVAGILANSNQSRLGNNIVGASVGNGGTAPLIVDPVVQGGGGS